MPPAHKKYSNDKRELVYISPKKKVAYCKVPKVGTNSWGSFFARAGEVNKNYYEVRNAGFLHSRNT